MKYLALGLCVFFGYLLAALMDAAGGGEDD